MWASISSEGASAGTRQPPRTPTRIEQNVSNRVTNVQKQRKSKKRDGILDRQIKCSFPLSPTTVGKFYSSTKARALGPQKAERSHQRSIWCRNICFVLFCLSLRTTLGPRSFSPPPVRLSLIGRSAGGRLAWGASISILQTWANNERRRRFAYGTPGPLLALFDLDSIDP